MNAYEPGTVAVATVRGVEGVRVMRAMRIKTENITVFGWRSAEAVRNNVLHSDNRVIDVRPLIVLDLDDPAQTVAVLRYWQQSGHGKLADLADAIEAQATPPVPPTPEPTGRGAYVTDAQGVEFRRDCNGDWAADWIYQSARPWADLAQPVTVHYAGLGAQQWFAKGGIV